MRHYLWAVGKDADAYTPGDTLADRYICESPRIFLDTKPSAFPGQFDEVPEAFIPYLKLSPYQIHIPQVHDWIQTESQSASVPLLLLNHVPLFATATLAERGITLPQASPSAAVQPFPALLEMWQAATPMRQLHWLWQIANLWQPMSSEGAVSSLLNGSLLRVEGPLLRLLELQIDHSPVPLAALGESWLGFVQTAKPGIQAPLQQICQQLIHGKIRNAEELVAALDGSIAAAQDRSQPLRHVQVSTLSDRGPSRPRNEDACYPASQTTANIPPADPLVIVCDGIGGHQGGDVASNLAIKSIEEQLHQLELDRLDPTTLAVELEKAVCVANDRISQQNDLEQRLERQRMGTTVVMGLLRAYELYITHVGDSQAYWITRWGCHQVTQDDDVASREVRLGYSTYPQALQQPSSGSLVQALGMGSSTNLYPTVQRFLLDEDCVFLLCSDGLSDNDQVEKYWETVILPLLDGKTNLAAVAQQLVEIANTQNGYDNATVGLIYYRADGSQPIAPPSTVTSVPTTPVQLPPTAPPRPADTDIFSPTTEPAAPSTAPASTLRTQQVERPRSTHRSSLLPLILGIIGLAGIAGALIALFFGRPDFNGDPVSSNQPAPTGSAPSQPNPSPTSSAPVLPLFETGTVVQASRSVTVQTVPPETPTESEQDLASIQPGSMVYIVKRSLQPANSWIRVTLCPSNADNLTSSGAGALEASPDRPTNAPITDSTEGTVAGEQETTPPATTPSVGGESTNPLTTKPINRPLQPGERAWINESTLRKAIDPTAPGVEPAQQAACHSELENFYPQVFSYPDESDRRLP